MSYSIFYSSPSCNFYPEHYKWHIELSETPQKCSICDFSCPQKQDVVKNVNLIDEIKKFVLKILILGTFISSYLSHDL